MRDITAGIALIKKFEGCRLTAYQDGAGFWTIGWGHRGPEVHEGLEWTQDQADAQLASDAARAIEAILKLVTVALTSYQLSALLSFVYNLGPARLKQSTLLRLINAGDMENAADEFIRWIYVAGKPSNGLLARREAEEQLFLGSPNPL